MRIDKTILRWIAVLAAVVLLAAACGDDDSGDAEPVDDDSSAEDTTGDDDGESDTDETDVDDSDMDESDMDDTDMDEPDDTDSDSGAAAISVQCAEIEEAMEAAGNLTALGGAPGDADLEQSFDQARASLAALGESAPEISGEVDEALEGLDALGEIFAEVGWNTDFSTNPEAGLELAAAMGNADVIGMIGAMTAISEWVATACTP